jgi:hypothetical protein
MMAFSICREADTSFAVQRKKESKKKRALAVG